MAKQISKKSKKLIFISFGKKLRSLRLAKGFTPAEFSRAVDISKEMLGRYERGEVEPKLVVIMKMADALKVHHLELLDIEIDN
ncbi:MAG TPA: helix-turn-helix transcriptional regulator [Cyclobacteriaceae bacterium]|nr:helix-turn-helix transcriptional regulator [Cyclobacteriaceae bacterium]